MLSKKILLRIAGVLVLFTFAGHTFGHFAPIPPDQTDMLRTIEIMKQTMIPMPIGEAKSFLQVKDGANLSVSIFLLISGILFFILSGTETSAKDKSITLVVSLGMLGIAILSVIYFFPMPAACTGLAALFGILSTKIA
jgi:hypothetical protein